MPPESTPAEIDIGALIVVAVVLHAVWLRTVTLRGWTLVDGTVVDFASRPFKGEDGPSVMSHPIVCTQLPNGETLKFEAEIGASPNPWAVGDAVQVQVKGETVKLHAPLLFNLLHLSMLAFALLAIANGLKYFPQDWNQYPHEQ